MTGAALESVIAMLRPLPLRGKGFVLDYVTPSEGTRQVMVTGSYAMTLNLADVIHRQIYMGCFARDMTRWASALLVPGGTFLDVGAHVGYFSLIAADRVGRTGRVVAVEPNPDVFESLCTHLADNGVANVEPCNWGLAECNEPATLHVPGPDGVRAYNATLLRRPHWTGTEISLRRLDDCFESWHLTGVDLMKVDVEGSEPRVIAGGATHLARGAVRHLMIEINGPRLVEAGSSPAALVHDLIALGFEPARLAADRAARVDWTDIDLDPTHERDFLFVHSAAAQETRHGERT